MKKIMTVVAAVLATLSLSATVYTPDPGQDAIYAIFDFGLEDGDIIVLSDGAYYEQIPMTFTTKVTFIAATNATPELHWSSISIKNDFEVNGIKMVNNSKSNYLLRTGGNVTGKIAFKNCSFQLNSAYTDATPYIYLSNNTVGELEIDNCIIKPNPKDGGAIVSAGSATIGTFTMTNCTAESAGNKAVYCENATNIYVDHCTFYNCGQCPIYLKGNTMTSYVVQNCIFSAPNAIDDYCVATYAGEVKNCVYYNYLAPLSTNVSISNCANKDPLFKDAANGDFKLKNGSPAIGSATDKSNLGDPRWGAELGPDMHDFLYFVGLNGNDTVKLNKSNASLAATFQYSKDRINWSDYTWPDNSGKGGAAIDLKNAGDTVFFRAQGVNYNGKNATMSTGSANYFQFSFGADDQIAAGGNIMSLYDATCEQDTMTEAGFSYLFAKANQLVSAPKLPAKKLASQCYQYMFFNCTSLTTAPALPATELKNFCYIGMFYGCTNLVQAPELKATTLAIQCYGYMFLNCSSLEVNTFSSSCDGAELVVPSLASAPAGWNGSMFAGCKGTVTEPQLGGHYCIKEYVDTLDYLHFVSLKDNGTVKLNKGSNAPACNVEYSKDNRKSWTAYTWTGTNGDPIALGLNDTVWFRAGGTTGKNTAFASNNKAGTYHFFVFGENDSIAAEGNIMSLLDASLKQNYSSNFAFCCLFQNCSALVSAPELPTTTLGMVCYYGMFQNCTSLKAAPALPAESLALMCYGVMFDGCTSLIQAPELKATTLADYCYIMMFNNCSSLQVDALSGDCNGAVLEVPSSSQASLWNSDMFKGCKGTVTTPQLGGKYCMKEYVTYTRNVTNGNYGTICLNRKFTATEGVEGLFVPYEKTATMLYCEEVELKDVVAGGAYIFKADSDVVAFTMEGEAVPAPVVEEGDYMIGWLGDTTNVDAAFLATYGDYSFLASNAIVKPEAGSTLLPNRAMIDLNSVPAKAAAPARGRLISFSLNGTDAATGLMQNAECTMQSGKMMVNGQLIIIRDGKMFNAQGQEL